MTESSTTTTETTTSNDNGTTEQTVTVQSSEQPAAQEPAVESSEQPVSQETTEVQSEQPAPQEPAAIIYEQQQPTAATSDITPADAEAENSPEEAEVAQEQAQATAEAEAPVVNSPVPKALTDEEIAALFSDENPYAPLNNQAILDELSNASDNLQGTPSTTVSTTTTTTVSSDQTANNAGLEVQQTDAPIIIETTKQEIGQPLVDPTLDQHQEQSVANPEALRLLHSTVYSQIRRLDKLSEQDRHFFEFFNRLLGEWASAKDVNAFTRKLDQVIRALQGRPVGLRRLAIADAADSHKIFDKITQLKDSVNGIVGNLGSTYDVAVKLSDTVGQGQHLAQEAKDFFSLKNPILTGGDAAAQNGQSTGFWGKIKGVFGSKRQLERHYGVTDTFDSLKNLYSSLESANNSAQELKKNVETAKKFADGVKEAFKVVGGLGA